MNKNKFMLVFGILSIAMVGMSPTAFAQTSQSSMNIGATCGITIGSALSFGTVVVDTISSEATLGMTGEGSTGSIVEVSGSDWLDTSDVNQVDGELTAFGLLTGTYASKTTLNSTDGTILMGTVTNGVTNSTYWMVDLLINDDTFEGAVTQTLTL